MLEISPRSREMAAATGNFNWFARAGESLDQDKPDGVETVTVGSWRQAIAALLSSQWENYLIDSANAVTVAVADWSEETYNLRWRDIVDQITQSLPADLEGRIREKLVAREKQRARAVTEVRAMIIWACSEEHWSQHVSLPLRSYRRMYDWLARGHLPCGAVGGYPSQRLMVF